MPLAIFQSNARPIMEDTERVPIELKIVAALFIVSGVFSALDIVFSLFRGSLNLDLGVLFIFVGLGLLRLQPLWHTLALLFTGLTLVGILVFLIWVILDSRPPSLEVFGQTVNHSAREVALVLGALYFALEAWKLYVLTRRDVKQLFDG
ncbi:MAG: hypothetical protein KatS3mg071_0163 [Meiothermus sp.]|nr:MAG: hypothetical protein KatS3mg071_0163 [Meiothermus sp.]